MFPVYGQETKEITTIFNHKNSVQLELFGHGLFYSLNYERVVLNRSLFKTTAQVGISYYPPKTGIMELWIPVLVNELISFKAHNLELGGGYIFTNEPVLFPESAHHRSWGGFLTGRVGYRYQKPNGHLILKAAFTPIFEYRGNDWFHPSGGLSVGYAF